MFNLFAVKTMLDRFLYLNMYPKLFVVPVYPKLFASNNGVECVMFNSYFNVFCRFTCRAVLACRGFALGGVGYQPDRRQTDTFLLH